MVLVQLNSNEYVEVIRSLNEKILKGWLSSQQNFQQKKCKCVFNIGNN